MRGVFFFPRIGSRHYPNFGSLEKKKIFFSFKPGGSFFFTRISSRPYQNFGTYRRVFLFFIRIGSRPYQNFGTYRRVFLFHQNWFATVPKFWNIQEGHSFSQEWVRDPTKIQDFLFKKMFPFQKVLPLKNVFQKVFF